MGDIHKIYAVDELSERATGDSERDRIVDIWKTFLRISIIYDFAQLHDAQITFGENDEGSDTLRW